MPNPGAAHLQARGNTAEAKARFLAAYAELGVIAHAAQAAGINRRTVKDWRDGDEAFAEAFADAGQDAIDALRAEVRRRAVEGVDEPVFYQGVPCGSVRKWSDVLLIFELKKRDPSYRDSFRHEHSGPGGGPLVTLLVPTDEERAIEIARMLAEQGVLEAGT